MKKLNYFIMALSLGVWGFIIIRDGWGLYTFWEWIAYLIGMYVLLWFVIGLFCEFAGIDGNDEYRTKLEINYLTKISTGLTMKEVKTIMGECPMTISDSEGNLMLQYRDRHVTYNFLFENGILTKWNRLTY